MTNDKRRDSGANRFGDPRGARDALHEGNSGPAALRVLRAGDRDAQRDSNVEYGAIDILPDPRIREELSALSNWPTIPQLFISGELVGGCDIVTEMFESGELAKALGVKQPEIAAAPEGAARRSGPAAAAATADHRLARSHSLSSGDPDREENHVSDLLLAEDVAPHVRLDQAEPAGPSSTRSTPTFAPLCTRSWSAPPATAPAVSSC